MIADSIDEPVNLFQDGTVITKKGA